MKKIGIVGGTAWHSTVEYYSMICQESDERYGTTPEFSIESLDLRKAMSMFGGDDDASWSAFDDYYREALFNLARSGASIAFFAATTPHHRFNHLTRGVPLEVVSLVDAVADEIRAAGLRSIQLFGTDVTMRSAAIRAAFRDSGVEVTVPAEHVQRKLAALIDRLQHGSVDNASEDLAALSNGVPTILGCTELTLAFPQAMTMRQLVDRDTPYFNALAIHAHAVLSRAC